MLQYQALGKISDLNASGTASANAMTPLSIGKFRSWQKQNRRVRMLDVGSYVGTLCAGISIGSVETPLCWKQWFAQKVQKVRTHVHHFFIFVFEGSLIFAAKKRQKLILKFFCNAGKMFKVGSCKDSRVWSLGLQSRCVFSENFLVKTFYTSIFKKQPVSWKTVSDWKPWDSLKIVRIVQRSLCEFTLWIQIIRPA